jgi:hypothetical protein
MVSGPGRGGQPRAAHACAMQPTQEEADQQVQPLQQLCRFLLVRPTLVRGGDDSDGELLAEIAASCVLAADQADDEEGQ